MSATDSPAVGGGSACRRGFTAWAVDGIVAWVLWLLRGQEDRLVAWLQANDPGEAW